MTGDVVILKPRAKNLVPREHLEKSTEMLHVSQQDTFTLSRVRYHSMYRS